MKRAIKLISKLALVAAGLLVGAWAFQAAPQPDGTAIYKQKCSMCHGVDGKGFASLKTPDFTDPKWQEATTDKVITTTIKLGKKGAAMPAFGEKLKEEEISALVAHIRSLNSSKKK